MSRGGLLVGRHLDGRHGVSCSSSSVLSELSLLLALLVVLLLAPFSVCTRRLSNSSPSSSIRLYSCIPSWACACSSRTCCLGFGLGLMRLRGCGGKRREARSCACSCRRMPRGSSRSDSKGRKPLARTLMMLRRKGCGDAHVSGSVARLRQSRSHCSCIAMNCILL